MAIIIGKELKRYSLQNGLILGLILLSFNIISFYLITTVVKSPIGVIATPYVFSIILPIPFAILFCYLLRASVGRIWDFRIATSGIFIMFLISYIVIALGRDVIFAHFVEPQMTTKIEKVLLDATPVALKKSGATDKQIADKQKDIREQFASQDNATVGQIIQSQVISTIFIFIISLIFGALFKNPVGGVGYELVQDDEA